MSKRAFVSNGIKGIKHKVFFISDGLIIKTWDTDTYLAMSRLAK